MAAATDSPSHAQPTPAWQFHRSLVVGLYWAAFLLAVLTGWVFQKHGAAAPMVGWGALLLCLATAAVAVWQTILLMSVRNDPGRQETLLAEMRRLLGFGMLAVSGVLLLLMLWLYQVVGLGAFPEVSSGVILVLIGIVVGLSQLVQTSRAITPEKILDWLLARRQQLTFVILGTGAVLFVLGVLFFRFGVFFRGAMNVSEAFPVAGGLLLAGLLFTGVGLWQMLTSPEAATAMSLRILILVLGGGTGVIITLMTGWAMIQNWNTIFAGGMATWQKEDAWMLWLTVYVGLFGLALMFGSLSLSRADIRRNATLRRMLYGYNAVFMGLLLFAALVVLNILVYASFPYSFNWTASQGFYALSNQSKKVLERLNEPVTVYVVMPQGGRNYLDVRNLLENCQAATNKLQVEYLSPDQDPERFYFLSQQYPKFNAAIKAAQGSGRGLLIVYGSGTKDLPPKHEFIPEQDLAERKPPMMHDPNQPPPPYEFKGELALMSQLKTFIGGGQKQIVYFTQSNGELDINDDDPGEPSGAGTLKQFLERNNFEVRGLVWDTRPAKELKGRKMQGLTYSRKSDKEPHKVPADADVVVIASPSQPFSAEVRKALDSYMNRGGHLMVFSSVVDSQDRILATGTGMEELLDSYGVKLERDYLFSSLRGVAVPYVAARMSPASSNEIARTFAKYQFILYFGQTVRPAGRGAAGFRAEVLMEVEPQAEERVFVDKDLGGLRNIQAYLNRLILTGQLDERRLREPQPVAVTVTDRDGKARMVVFGDGRLASNFPIPTRGISIPYKQLMLSSFAWLTNRPEDISDIPPKRSNYYRIAGNVDLRRMLLLPFGLMVLGLIGLGTGVWVVRRR
jgi:hypothetical protein